MKIAIIDNYDSFTYNLAHSLRRLGAEIDVHRNDRFLLPELERYDGIVLSPGPGIPDEAGLLMQTIGAYAGRRPMLGICLGEQAIGEAFGGRLVNLSDVFHGVQTPVEIIADDDPIFRRLPKVIRAGRYHSWAVDRDGFPKCLEITAVSEEGQIMALRHRDMPIWGIQFHPESVLTPDGDTILGNWLAEAGRCAACKTTDKTTIR